MATDAFGRKIGDWITSELKSKLLGSVKGDTKEEKYQNTLEKISENVEKIAGKSFEREFKVLINLVRKISKCCEQGNKKATRETITVSDPDLNKSVKGLRADTQTLASKIDKGTMPGVINGGTNKNTATVASSSAPSSLVKSLTKGVGKEAVSVAADVVGGMVGGLVGGIIDLVTAPLKKRLEVLSDEAAIIFSRTGGVKNLTKQAKIFNVEEEEARDIGFSREKIQDHLIKNAKRGMSIEKDTLKNVTRISLQTAKQIGLSAEDTSDHFADWNQKLGLSVYQLGIMSRGIRNVSMQTGLVGKELSSVVKSSETFMNNMRLSGTFTASGGKNIMGFLGQAQKTGTTEGAQRILGALQHSILAEGGDDRIRNLLIKGAGGNADIRKQLIGGTVPNDKASMREMAKNWQEELNSLSRAKFQGKNFNQLDENQKGLLSQVTERNYNVKSAEWQLLIKNIMDSTKPFKDEMESLTKAIKEGRSEEDKQIAKQKQQQLVFDTGAEILGEFNRGLERGLKVNEAFGAIKNKDLAPYLGSIGASGKAAPEAIGDILRKQAATQREKAKGLGPAAMEKFASSQISDEEINKAIKDLKNGKDTGFKAVSQGLSDLNDKLAEQARKETDPSEKIKNAIDRIRASVEKAIDLVLQTWLPKLGKFMDKVEPLLGRIADAVEFIAHPLANIGTNPYEGTTEGVQARTNVATTVSAGLPVKAKALEAKTPAQIADIKKRAEYLRAEIDESEKNINNMVQFGSADYMTALADQRRMLAASKKLLTDLEATAQAGEAIKKAKTDQEKTEIENTLRQKKYGDNSDAMAVASAKSNEEKKTIATAAIKKNKDAIEEENKIIRERQEAFDNRSKWEKARDLVWNTGGLRKIKEDEKSKDRIAALEAKNAQVNGALTEMAEEATKEKSIYTHDIHVEELLTKIFGSGGSATALAMKQNFAMPKLPYQTDIEQELKKGTLDEDTSGLSEIEENTRETASNSRKMVILLNTLGRLLSKQRRRTSGAPNVELDIDNQPFYEEILNTEWPRSRLEFDLGEFD